MHTHKTTSYDILLSHHELLSMNDLKEKFSIYFLEQSVIFALRKKLYVYVITKFVKH